MINYYLQQEQELREKQHEEEYLDWQTELAMKRERVFAEGKFDALCYGEPLKEKFVEGGAYWQGFCQGMYELFARRFGLDLTEF